MRGNHQGEWWPALEDRNRLDFFPLKLHLNGAVVTAGHEIRAATEKCLECLGRTRKVLKENLGPFALEKTKCGCQVHRDEVEGCSTANGDSNGPLLLGGSTASKDDWRNDESSAIHVI